MGEAGRLSAIGVLVGLVAAFAFNKMMASLVYGVGSTDPLTFFGVAVGLLLIALVAAYLTGRRATRVDPIVALRNE
jgi:ABC-type antimicrobial peptide transport system permease subunit